MMDGSFLFAIDNGNPTRSNNTQLVVNVIDENDNVRKNSN